MVSSEASIQLMANGSLSSLVDVLLEKYAPKDQWQDLDRILAMCPKVYSGLLTEFVEKSRTGRPLHSSWLKWLTHHFRRLGNLTRADHQQHMLHLVRSCFPATPADILPRAGADAIKAMLACVVDSAVERRHLRQQDGMDLKAMVDGIIDGTKGADQGGKRKRDDPGFMPLVDPKEDGDAGLAPVGMDDIQACEARVQKIRKIFEEEECQVENQPQETADQQENTGGH